MDSVNYERLFREGRLNPNNPEHKTRIEARLASLNIESEPEYNQYRALYDAKIDEAVEHEEEVTEEDSEDEEMSIEEVNEKLKELGVELHPRTGEEKRRAALAEALSPTE